jgi:Ser/Thr protein kinase RdoA (MazF antagonist)
MDSHGDPPRRELIVLPTARLIAPELQAELGPLPPALLPLDGTPAYRHILEALDRPEADVVLAAHQGAGLLAEHLARFEHPRVRMVDVGPTESLAATVLAALDAVDPDGYDRLIVNFADTIVGDLPPEGDAICFRRQRDVYRWTTFEHTDDGHIGAVVDKGVAKPDPRQRCVMVGVFAIADVPAFVTELGRAIAHSDCEVEPLFEAVAAYANRRGAGPALFETRVWHDFGHLDTYYQARQRFYLNKRFFNDVEVDTTRGVLRKTSADHAKLAREISWYLELPRDLAHLAPRVLAHSLEGPATFVELEFYGYPPLAEAYLHGNWDPGLWAQAFDALGELVARMRGHTLDVPAETRAAALAEMYEAKTEERCRPLLDDPAFAPLAGERAEINGRAGLGLAGALRVLPALAEATGLHDRDRLSVIHGDLCLSNILFDRRNAIVRLVDPRGSFGPFGLYGDPLYDLAKLAHSIHGDYDHMLHGQFDLEPTTKGVTLSAHVTERQDLVKAQFAPWLAAQAGPDLDKVTLIEGLLFTSMVPLHADRPRSQLAFLARGLELLSGVAVKAGLDLDRVTVAA